MTQSDNQRVLPLADRQVSCGRIERDRQDPRWTFYIDREGVIREIDKKVSVKSAGQDIARKLEQLGFPRAGSTGG